MSEKKILLTKSNSVPLPNQLFYKTTDGKVRDPYALTFTYDGVTFPTICAEGSDIDTMTAVPATIVSNEYKNGYGILTFDKNLYGVISLDADNIPFYNGADNDFEELIIPSTMNYCLGSTTKKIVISEGMIEIVKYAFQQNPFLKEITIPNSVTSIGSEAFGGCTGLTSVTIPNSVTSIGDYAFRDCTGLTSITIPDGVTSIGEETFKGCSSLTSITIPNSVTSIGFMSFWGCGLTSITIPDSVINIGGSAFEACKNLKSVTFETITPPIIGESIFFECSNLVSIFVPSGSVEVYKTTTNFTKYADKIKPIK